MTAPAPTALTAYLRFMRAAKMRPETIRGRRVTLQRIERSIGPLAHVTAARLIKWQADRADQVGVVSLIGEISALRCFFAWAQESGVRRDNPATRLRPPRKPRAVPRPITEDALGDALAAADNVTRAILALAAMAGLRACEIAELGWADVDLSGQVLTVVDGKGGHSRRVPMSPQLIEVLEALPTRRGPVIRRLDGRGGNTKPHSISHRANDHLHGLGITATLHQLRHRAGTVAYQATQDLLAVQHLLGHASPTTTSGYARAAGASVQAAAAALGKVGAGPTSDDAVAS